MFQPSEVITTLNGERKLTWLLSVLRWTGLWTLHSRSAEPVRGATNDDAAWEKKERDYAPVEMSYYLKN